MSRQWARLTADETGSRFVRAASGANPSWMRQEQIIAAGGNGGRLEAA